MKRSMGFFIVVLVGLSVLFFSGCKQPGVPVGTVIVNLTGAVDADGDFLYAYIYAEGETDTENDAKILATVNLLITSGIAEIVLEESNGSGGSNKNKWTGIGGTTYDIYIYTSNNSNSPEDYAPSKKKVPFPGTVTIDGNKVITVDYGEMAPYTDPVT